MMRYGSAAVWHNKDETFRIVPHCVESNCKPEIARPPHGETEKETDQARAKRSNPVFTRVTDVNRAEYDRENPGSRPESNPTRQSEEGISAKEKFFEEPYYKESHCPDGAFKNQLSSPFGGERSEAETVIIIDEQ